jgi:glycosyltransferase involved in cell wall biosynthesis
VKRKSDVVIPARNDQDTVGKIIQTCLDSEYVGRVILSIDNASTDSTDWIMSAFLKRKRFHMVTGADGEGKGQTVRRGLDMVTAERVVFCDADLTGLTTRHVKILADVGPYPDMVVGVPDYPDIPEDLPTAFTRNGILRAWSVVSGERSVPTAFALQVPLHGYLMETQINNAAALLGLTADFRTLKGLTSPLNLTDQRVDDMNRDRAWGIQAGILPK